MKMRKLIEILAVCLMIVCALAPAYAATKKNSTYTMRVVAFTATPKSPTLAKSKLDFKEIIKQTPILPESGAPFVLDLSTPTRLRKQIEAACKDYNCAITASGSVTCGNADVCPIDIPPSPDDLSKAQFKGEWSPNVKDISTANIDIKELTLYMLLPGQSKVLPVQTVKTAKIVSLNRTYILSGTARQQDGKTTLWVFAFSIVPGN